MYLTHVWRRAVTSLKQAAAIVVAAACVMTTSSPAFAGTTGVIRGTVTASGAPLAAVRVTVKAPSGSYQSSTDARGFYSVTGVYADTYTVSFEKQGYDGQVVSGVTVFADQTATVNATLNKSLQTIAKVVARSASSAYQPELTTDTYTVTEQQVQNLQGSDLNLSESNLITSLPGVSYDSSGYPVIHGGRENEEGFMFEGIPYTDAYTNQFVNTLSLPGSGIASVQLTPGVGDASVQSNGTGIINLVAKRGSYPGTAHAEFRVGGPGFDHAFNFDYGFATPNGNISEYVAFSGAQTSPRYGDGTYPSNQIGQFNNTLLQTDREFLNNFIVRFGKNHNQAVQLFADVAQHNFFDAYGGLNGLCFQSCNPYFQNFYNGIYGLTKQQLASIVPLYPGQTSPLETLQQAANRPQNTYYQPNEAYKLAYTLNLGPSTYLLADIYSVNSVVTFDNPTAFTNSLGLGDYYVQQGGHSLGGTIRLQKQLNEKNLIDLGYEYAWRHPIDSFQSTGYGFLSYLINGAGDTLFTPLDFVNPNQPCPFGPGACGYAYGAFPNANQLTVPTFDQTSTINRRDTSFFINDKITVNDRLNISVGLRNEKADYVGLPTPQLLPDCTFLYNPASAPANPNYDPTKPAATGNCPFTPDFSNITNAKTHPSVLEPRFGISWQFAKNSALRFTYERAASFPTLSFVDVAVDRNAYNGYNGLAPFSLLDELLGIPHSFTIPTVAGVSSTNVATCGIATYAVPCHTYADELFWAQQNFNGVPFQPLLPMTSSNYTLTLEHQFTKGLLNGVALSIAPWTRHQYNTEASVAVPLVGPNGQPEFQNGQLILGPATITNLGKEYATGVDVNITKTNPIGWSGQWTMSYVNEFSSVIPTSASEDFFPSIPYSSALLGNVYRVGFLSPFTTTLGLTYRTRNGWRFNPRFQYDIGYPIGNGALTSAFVNGTAVNIPNTNVLPGGAASASGINPYVYVDPLNPGSVFNPNAVATSGFANTNSAGGKLTKPSLFTNFTAEYSPPNSRYRFGFDVENVFNKLYSSNGVFQNPRYQPVATGIAGPLTGNSTHSLDYTQPYANPTYLSNFGGNGPFVNLPGAQPRSYYFYMSVKV